MRLLLDRMAGPINLTHSAFAKQTRDFMTTWWPVTERLAARGRNLDFDVAGCKGQKLQTNIVVGHEVIARL